MSAFPKLYGFCEVYEEENVSQGGGERGRLFEGVATGNIHSLLRAMYIILGIVIRIVELIYAAFRCDVALILQSHIWGLNYMGVFSRECESRNPRTEIMSLPYREIALPAICKAPLHYHHKGSSASAIIASFASSLAI